MVKNLPANAGDTRDAGLIPGPTRSVEKEMATHSSILAWRIPWTDEPRWASPRGRKESDTTEHTHGVKWAENINFMQESLETFKRRVKC